MTKTQFTVELAKRLAGIPKEDMARSLDYYIEMIDDRMDDGMTEEEAVAALGSIEEIAEQILSEVSLFKLLKEKIRPRRTLRGWEIALLAVGALFCLPIVAAIIGVFISVYAVLWSVVVVLYAADVAFFAGVLGGLGGGVGLLLAGPASGGVALLGFGMLSAGLAILLLLGCNRAAKGMLWISKKIWLGIKTLFVRKGERV